jgi:hypothetical protein
MSENMTPTPKPRRPVVFGRRDTGEEKEAVVGLAQFAPAAAPKRKVKALDLTGTPAAWLLIGQGRSGKTMFARWAGGRAEEGLRQVALAALDPTNRSLAMFLEGVQQPDTPDPTKTAIWLHSALDTLALAKIPGVMDMGGGDTSLLRAIGMFPSLLAESEAQGIAPVAAYFVSPRIDDLSALDTFEDKGFRPRATVIVLNDGLVDLSEEPEEAFARTETHSAVRSAVARGAVVIHMPRLLTDGLAREIERKRLSFAQARDGVAPAGVTPICGTDRYLVRRWLDQMEEAFAPVKSWLP